MPAHKTLHRILIILIFVSVTSAAYLFATPKNNSGPPLPTDKQTYLAPSSTPTVETLTPAILKNNVPTEPAKSKNNAETFKPSQTAASTTPSTSTPPDQKPETAPIKFIIEGTEYSIQVKPNSTVYEAMIALQNENEISFSTKNFSSLGKFVESINGKKNSPSAGFYWTYYINNQEAQLGISNYTIKPNDLITWKYENK